MSITTDVRKILNPYRFRPLQKIFWVERSEYEDPGDYLVFSESGTCLGRIPPDKFLGNCKYYSQSVLIK